MNDTSKVTEAGQVTIPKHLRDKLNITPETHLKVTYIGNSVIFQKGIDKDMISYSFLYNQITKLQYELNRQKELYAEQQQNIINISLQVGELMEKMDKMEKKKK